MTTSTGPEESSERRRIAIAGGGTAGHVYPALAVGEMYQQSYDGVDLLFIGTSSGCEATLVPQAGHRFEQVSASPVFGVGAVGKVGAFWRLVRGAVQARRILRANQTKLVIGLGGYASAGALLAARSLGLATAVHETNIVPGLTNRFLGCIVDRVYLGFDNSRPAFSKSKILVSGNPVRSEVASIGRKRTRKWGNGHRPARLLVTGGSGGSFFLNERAPDLMARIASAGLNVEVRHQVGNFDPAPVRQSYQSLGVPVVLSSYIDDMPAAYRWADFAVACSGSGTLAELAIVGLPALLVPMSSAASDHQAANAAAFVAAGGGMWVREEEWQADVLAPRIVGLLRNPEAWRRASEGAGRLATPDAAHAIIADCEAMMAGRW